MSVYLGLIGAMALAYIIIGLGRVSHSKKHWSEWLYSRVWCDVSQEIASIYDLCY
jgi:hypothetical protein